MLKITHWSQISVLALLLSFLGVSNVYAQTYTVTSFADDADTVGTIRNAIEKTTDTTIIFDFDALGLAEGQVANFTLSAPLVIGRALTIEGQQRVNLIPAIGTEALTVNANVTIDGVNINGNDAARGIQHNSGTLNLSNMDILNTTGDGGAAIGSIGGTLNILDNVNIQRSNQGTGGDLGAVYIGGSATADITALRVLISRVTTSGGGAALHINTTNGSTIPIKSSAFSGTASSGVFLVRVEQGKASFTRVTIADDSLASVGGIHADGGTTVALNYVTLTGLAGSAISGTGTISVRGIINHDNGSACAVGTNINQASRNIFSGNIGNCNFTGGGEHFDTDPKISAFPSESPYIFTPLNDSPVVDRGEATCGAVQDVRLLTNLGGNACDLGSVEVPNANTATVAVGEDTLALTEQTPEDTRLVTFEGSIFPVTDVEITFSSDPNSECSITPNPITITAANFTSGAGETLTIGAVDDADAEGLHTCTVAVSNINANGDPVYQNATVDDVVVTITDNDGEDQPAVVVDLSAFEAPNPLMKEGDEPRQVKFTLAGPPKGPVRISIETAKGAEFEECNYPAVDDEIVLDQTNWSVGRAFEISAIVDAERETTQTECEFVGKAVYTNPASELAISNRKITLDPDPNQQLGWSPGTLGPVSEGQSRTSNLSLLYTIPDGSIERYTLEFDVVNVGGDPGVTTQCSVSPTSVTFNSSSSQATITIQAVNDGVVETDHSCQITPRITDFEPTLPLVTALPTLTFNILEDDTGEPDLIITGLETFIANDPTDAGIIALVEGIDTANFILSMSTVLATPTNYTISEVSGSPNPPSPQCNLSATNVTLDGFSNFPFEIEPVDDLDAEPGTHNCIIEFRKNGTDLVFTLTVNITDDDDFKAYTLPDMTVRAVPVVEGNSTTITYGLTTDPTGDGEIGFVVEASDACNLGGVTSITLNAAQKTQTVQVFAPVNESDDPDINEICTLSAIFTNIPPNYAGAVGADADGFVPDIKIQVFDVIPPPDEPTATPSDATPTPVSDADEENVEVLQTEQANNEAEATANAIAATEVPLPTVSVNQDITQLPVRTGPYLGASIVTIITRQGETIDEINKYRVFARSNDETAEVTWYQIGANGKIGWVSGRSSSLNDSYTDESLPFAGSVFDEINTGTDLGVVGTLILDRNIHRRPSRRAGISGFLGAGNSVSVIGRTVEFPYDDWYLVRGPNGEVGWIEPLVRTDEPAIIVDPDLIRDRVPAY